MQTVHYRKDGIATFEAPTERIFTYMSSGGHVHRAIKSYRLVGVSGNEVTISMEAYNPDGSTWTTTLTHKLSPPGLIESSMKEGPFDGARFAMTYTVIGGKTKVDVVGDFPLLPEMTEAGELGMIDQWFTSNLAEDEVTLRTLPNAARTPAQS